MAQCVVDSCENQPKMFSGCFLIYFESYTATTLFLTTSTTTGPSESNLHSTVFNNLTSLPLLKSTSPGNSLHFLFATLEGILKLSPWESQRNNLSIVQSFLLHSRNVTPAFPTGLSPNVRAKVIPHLTHFVHHTPSEKKNAQNGSAYEYQHGTR